MIKLFYFLCILINLISVTVDLFCSIYRFVLFDLSSLLNCSSFWPSAKYSSNLNIIPGLLCILISLISLTASSFYSNYRILSLSSLLIFILGPPAKYSSNLSIIIRCFNSFISHIAPPE